MVRPEEELISSGCATKLAGPARRLASPAPRSRQFCVPLPCGNNFESHRVWCTDQTSVRCSKPRAAVRRPTQRALLPALLVFGCRLDGFTNTETRAPTPPNYADSIPASSSPGRSRTTVTTSPAEATTRISKRQPPQLKSRATRIRSQPWTPHRISSQTKSPKSCKSAVADAVSPCCGTAGWIIHNTEVRSLAVAGR